MILWLRFLDYIGSKWRRFWKARKYQSRWGSAWENYERSGRKFSRVETRPWSKTGSHETGDFRELPAYQAIRPEPGWEWTCQNCKTYSFIRESDMPAILRGWEAMAENAIKRGYKVPIKPTPAIAGCPNCRYRPGDPE